MLNDDAICAQWTAAQTQLSKAGGRKRPSFSEDSRALLFTGLDSCLSSPCSIGACLNFWPDSKTPPRAILNPSGERKLREAMKSMTTHRNLGCCLPHLPDSRSNLEFLHFLVLLHEVGFHHITLADLEFAMMTILSLNSDPPASAFQCVLPWYPSDCLVAI